MSSASRDNFRPSDAVAGVMAAGAIFLGFFELFYRPFRLAPAALVLALIALVMSRQQQRLAGIAVAVIGICFVIGVTLQVLTNHPLY